MIKLLVLATVLKLLPVISGPVHVWNPTDETLIITRDGIGRFVPPYSTTELPSSTSIELLSDSRLVTWSDYDGAQYEAIEPRTEWRVNVQPGVGISTGIGIANQYADNDISFTLNTLIGPVNIKGMMYIGRWNTFVSQLFNLDATGTLVIKSAHPISVVAALCLNTTNHTGHCSPIKVQ